MSSPSPAKAPRTRVRRRILWAVAMVAILAIIALLAIGWVGSEHAIHPAVAHYSYAPADFPDLHPQEIAIDSRTHAKIAAELFPGTRRATIVLSHGYGDNQVQMLPYAKFLHDA